MHHTSTTGGVIRPGPAPRARPARRTVLRAAAGLGAAAGALGASGCSAFAGGNGRTTVRIWSWLTGMDKYVAAFNASQRKIHVELNVIAAGLSGGYAQQTNSLRAHNAPDILHAEYQGLPQLLTTGGLRELTDDLADLADGYTPAAWKGVRPDGRTWAVPMDLAPMAFYYRKDLFDRHRIQVPRTWREFRETAQEVREADRNARITTFPLNDGSFYAGMSWQAKDPWWSVAGDTWRVGIDAPGTLRTSRYWQRLIEDGLVRAAGTGTQEWIAAIHKGRLWGLLGAAWSAGLLLKSIPDDKERWAVTTMPTWDGDAANGMQGGTAFAVSAESEVPEAATTFLRWLSTDPEVARIGTTFTSPFPAYEPSRKVARAEFKNDWFLGEPVYDVLDEAARRVPEWTWGPTALGAFATVQDAIGGAAQSRGTLPRAIHGVQSSVVRTMRRRGLSVAERGSA